MKIEIWSDVACPFCYIGKRRLEEALSGFEHQSEVEIEWKSFQLNPELKTDKVQSIHEYLADAKGWTIDYAKQMGEQVTAMAEEVGLKYNLDATVVANTLNAHRLIQYAKTQKLGDAIEEALFIAYFMQGKNIDNKTELIEIAVSVGLNAVETEKVLDEMQFSEQVEFDAYEAQQIGVRGVPFFVFNRKYGISGAQPLEVFTRTLHQAYTEEIKI
jgi:predicted DsbA family dithiol-disulfide isomerase